jgi:hypothetical protein
LGLAIDEGTPAEIQAAALAVGDDIFTEYYYMDGATKVYLKTINNNDLIKNKYWDKYLVGPSPADNRYPDWANSVTLAAYSNLQDQYQSRYGCGITRLAGTQHLDVMFMLPLPLSTTVM